FVQAIFNFVGIVQTKRSCLHAEGGSYRLNGAELRRSAGAVSIAQHGDPGQVRRDLLEQLQPFGADIVFKIRKAGRVAARFRETFNKPAADGVSDLNENNGDGVGCPLERPDMRAAGGQYDVRSECDELGRILARALGIAPGPAIIDPEIAPAGPTELLQALNKRIEINF